MWLLDYAYHFFAAGILGVGIGWFLGHKVVGQ